MTKITLSWSLIASVSLMIGCADSGIEAAKKAKKEADGLFVEKCKRVKVDMSRKEVDAIFKDHPTHENRNDRADGFDGKLPRPSTLTVTYDQIEGANEYDMYCDVYFDAEGRVVGAMWSRYLS